MKLRIKDSEQVVGIKQGQTFTWDGKYFMKTNRAKYGEGGSISKIICVHLSTGSCFDFDTHEQIRTVEMEVVEL